MVVPCHKGSKFSLLVEEGKKVGAPKEGAEGADASAGVGGGTSHLLSFLPSK
jgi:hypothetical protein